MLIRNKTKLQRKRYSFYVLNPCSVRVSQSLLYAHTQNSNTPTTCSHAVKKVTISTGRTSIDFGGTRLLLLRFRKDKLINFIHFTAIIIYSCQRVTDLNKYSLQNY